MGQVCENTGEGFGEPPNPPIERLFQQPLSLCPEVGTAGRPRSRHRRQSGLGLQPLDEGVKLIGRDPDGPTDLDRLEPPLGNQAVEGRSAQPGHSRHIRDVVEQRAGQALIVHLFPFLTGDVSCVSHVSCETITDGNPN